MTEAMIFYPLAGLVVIAALAVLVARNPVYGAMSLVACFFCLSGIYVVLAAHFVAVLQVLVYAGAIMVLFMFVIMLLALTREELGGPKVTLFKILGAGAAGTLAWLTYGATRGLATEPKELSPGFGSVAEVGAILMNQYLLPFEVVSLLLLVAIVGAVVVAKGRI